MFDHFTTLCMKELKSICTELMLKFADAQGKMEYFDIKRWDKVYLSKEQFTIWKLLPYRKNPKIKKGMPLLSNINRPALDYSKLVLKFWSSSGLVFFKSCPYENFLGVV